ncbi:hypothetical protein S406_19820 [Salmonella enterica]|uniref:Permease n=1 Tax=Salmonella enterica subsp. enterica serovar Kentucky TaxID=192955 RepID=A0A5X6KPZ7_SALET|nr:MULTISPECIES: hypothetical protein [Salmonella]EAA8480450.1 hypothetical protein [Salmonella enterica subsp. enterica]EEL6817608.1 hypothetical protein [Salmonella enterica subsp. enterica serovar Montevideo]EEN3044557.1 hypothetical protein [Salmonella enterica subsp. enterica serovar Enteritidis]EEP7016302.1 hypothetical protein [Salmonella enterica subsp. enterica serovar Lubbock]EHG8826254.1 hypothetical protein [Salmonella enterica subsp. enterica serovar Cerro]
MSQNLKNDLVNIVLLGVLLLGLMLAQDSGWGFLLAGLPLVIWCFKAFAFIQRRWWLAVPFWCALTYLCWQMSLALWAGYLFVAFVRNMMKLNKTYPIPSRHKRMKLDSSVFMDSFDYDYRNHIGFDD